MLLRQPSFDFLNHHHSLTFHLAWATIVASIGTFQFGYHLSELNAASSIISCKFHRPGPHKSYDQTIWYQFGLEQCIPMTEQQSTMMTTMFTFGGLISSIIISSSFFHCLGRKTTCIMSSLFFMLGSFFMMISNNTSFMNAGRLLCGLGAGISVVISPILINELTPINHRGFLGSFLQVSLSVGIFTSQLISIPNANDQNWRYIFLTSFLISLVQFVLLFTIVESPKWLVINKNDTNNATDILTSLRSNVQTVPHEINHWRRLSITKSEVSESTPLIEDLSVDFHSLQPVKSRRGSIDPSNLTLYEFVTERKYRKELLAVILIMSGNQLCGMNSITFYGVSFLSNIVPDTTNILYLTSLLGLFNVLGAGLATPLFDRLGRKKLLLLSCLIMSITSFGISMGLVTNFEILVAVSCLLFILGYCIGLGPIVYLMVPEFTNHNVVAIAQSFGTTLNWISNMCIAYWFPVIHDTLGGYVFFVFTFINLAYLFLIILFVPETKLKTYDEVWNHFTYI